MKQRPIKKMLDAPETGGLMWDGVFSDMVNHIKNEYPMTEENDQSLTIHTDGDADNIIIKLGEFLHIEEEVLK